jgi:DNA-binding CsgD family transcriptional regulator/RecA/RadA recombinase
MVGRQAERARIDEHLNRLPSGGVIVALEGSPGIGKTTLWHEAVAVARRHGYAVRASIPTEPDARLAFAGLGDLLDLLPDDVWAELPAPQRRALSVALMVEGDSEATHDAPALPRAVVAALRALAARGPLLIAIDDEQWLDPPTARVLAFALPRLREDPIGVVLARRTEAGGELWAPLVRQGEGDGVLTVPVEPLDLDAIEALVGDALTRRLPRSVVRRIHDTSGGNPLYALAIAREFQRRGDSGGELPIPDTLAEAISQRLAGVGEAADEPLLAVAAASHATLALLQAVTDGFTLADLDAAVEAEVIEIAGDRVRFTHPLLASTHYGAASPARQRAIHRRLADVVDDPQQRARHTAFGAEAPARSIAAVIEQGADVAAGRGAPETAAELLEEAARLTPADAREARHARLIRAAEMHEIGGSLVRCRELLGALIPALAPGPLRARALDVLAEATDDMDAVDAILAEALVDARGHHGLLASICRRRAGNASNRAEFGAMVQHARAAVAHAERSGDASLLAHALAEVATADFFIGQPVDLESLGRVAQFADPDEGTSRDSPAGWLAEILWWSDDYARGRPAMERQVQRARDRGESRELAALAFELGLCEWYAGNVEIAERLHAEGRENMDIGDELTFESWLASGEAMFAARRGDLEYARDAAERATALCRANNDLLIELFGIIVLGTLDLWAGDPGRAHERLHATRESFMAKGFGFLGALTIDVWAADAEALIALGRLDEAQAVADDLAARARTVENPNAVAVAARCHGMILSARGDQLAALSGMREALEAHAYRPLRPEIARTLLEEGIVLRRSKQKNAAKQSLEEALAIFEEIGARMWSDRARDELARVGLRRRREQQDGLTPAQTRVVALVCEGMSNQQIASTLYMSQRSVEAHLTKAYREYGVRSRAQLVATLAGQSRFDGGGP